MRRTGLALAVLSLWAMGCGSSSSSTSKTTHPPAFGPKAERVLTAHNHGWTGIGGKLSVWEAAHPRGTAGCSAGKCFGDHVEVAPGESRYEYIGVETTPEGRVDGYQEALGGGELTPGAAEHIALSNFPHDTRVISTEVSHENGSCKLITVKSKTLGRWFANPRVSDGSGVMSIDIHGVSPESGESTYPDHLSEASVSLGHATPGC
jgi:hypothetical protein